MSSSKVKSKITINSQNGLSSKQSSSSNMETSENAGDSCLCPVCHDPIEIFAIGPCDHPCCYQCSTRMRVLCEANECPICRSLMPQVSSHYDLGYNYQFINYSMWFQILVSLRLKTRLERPSQINFFLKVELKLNRSSTL